MYCTTHEKFSGEDHSEHVAYPDDVKLFSTPTTGSKNSSEKCTHGNPGFCGICADKELDEMEGKNRSRNTTDKGWESQKERIGGRIHEVLNNTLSRKLTVEEYKRVVKDIGALAKTYESAAAKEEYERGRKDARQDIDKLYYSEEVAEQEDPIYQAGMIDGILRAKEAALETQP